MAAGASLRTFIRVVRALGGEHWFETIAPAPSVNPLMLTRAVSPRRRASEPRLKKQRERLWSW